MIVLPKVASDGRPRFLQALVLADSDFLLLQAAVEPFDVAVALRVVVGGTAVGNSELGQGRTAPR